MQILFLSTSALFILAIAAGLISALLILPIPLRVALLMLLAVVLMLVVATLAWIPLTRILLLRFGLVGIVLTLFVTHHFHSLQANFPRLRKCHRRGKSKGCMPYTKRLCRQTAGTQIWP